jgi:hypothetical protein
MDAAAASDLGAPTGLVMATQTVTLDLPERLYLRLRHIAEATRRPLEDVLLRAIDVGSPPAWEDAPAEVQPELAAMDRLDDDALWAIARGMMARDDPRWVRFAELVERQKSEDLGAEDVAALDALQDELDRFTLRKAHAAALLKWRGRRV